MPIAGLVLSLDEDPGLRQSALAALLLEPMVTFGEAQGSALPVVTEASDIAAQEALWARIEGTPGVTAVALVTLDFEDVEAFDVPVRRLRRGRGEMRE